MLPQPCIHLLPRDPTRGETDSTARSSVSLEFKLPRFILRYPLGSYPRLAFYSSLSTVAGVELTFSARSPSPTSSASCSASFPATPGLTASLFMPFASGGDRGDAGSSSQITGSSGNPMRVSKVCANDRSIGFAADCSVGGYIPAASNKYLAGASCPVFATLITSVAISSAESFTSSLMFARTWKMSFPFFLFDALLFACFFAVTLLFLVAFFFALMTRPPQNCRRRPDPGFSRVRQSHELAAT